MAGVTSPVGSPPIPQGRPTGPMARRHRSVGAMADAHYGIPGWRRSTTCSTPIARTSRLTSLWWVEFHSHRPRRRLRHRHLCLSPRPTRCRRRGARSGCGLARGRPIEAWADRVRWILGDMGTMPPLQVDVATMTGNVAQVFVEDHDWSATLEAIPARRCGPEDASSSRAECPRTGRGADGRRRSPTPERKSPGSAPWTPGSR